MSLLNNIVGGGAKLGKEVAPSLRFSGWEKIGAQTRPADTRTTAQLLKNIEYFAQRNPEVAKFKNELKSVNPKHLGLVSDICELGNHNEMMSQSIDMKALKDGGGKSLLSSILEKLPKASRENPQAMEFTKEVIDHTDTTASKYFLADFGGILDCPQAAKHLEATKPLVKNIAEETLNGYKMDFENERNFMNTIRSFVDPTAKPEKIAMVKEILQPVQALPDRDMMHIDRFIRSEAPAAQIRANMPQLKHASDMACKRGDWLNIDEFLTTNVNYAKAPQKLDIEAIKAGDVKLG